MIFIDFPWMLMIPNDFQWFSMIFIEFLLSFNDFQWISLIFQWFSLIFIDFLWMLMIPMDFQWISMIFIVFQWFSLNFNWFSLILIEFHGFHGFHGFRRMPWNPYEKFSLARNPGATGWNQKTGGFRINHGFLNKFLYQNWIFGESWGGVHPGDFSW